jgi:hypothetical protein
VSQDDCKTWTDLTANVPELPDWGTVECIEPSPHDAGTAYLVVDNHRMDDYRPHVWKTTDFGKTWTRITVGLDAGTHCNAVREDPKKKGQLYLGTERGIMISTDGGGSWASLQLNLPTVPVSDLQVKDSDLVVGTHGRSIWILDDLTVVRNWKPANANKPARLYDVQPATKWALGGGGIFPNRSTSTRNPDYGAVVWYHLKDEPKEDLTLEVLNAAGKVIATAEQKAKKDKGSGGREAPESEEDDEDDDDQDKKARKMTADKGLNKFVWDFTHDGADTIPGAKVDAGNPGMDIPAAPGKYTVKLTVGKQTQTTAVEVKADPRLDPKTVTVVQETFALKVRDHIQQLTDTVLRLRAVQKQIGVRKDLFKDDKAAEQQLKDEAAFAKKLATLEEKLHNPKAKIVYDVFAAKPGAMLYSQLTWLLGNAIDGDGLPTKAQTELEVELAKVLGGYVGEFDKLTGEELKKLNESAKKASLPEVYLPPAKKK